MKADPLNEKTEKIMVNTTENEETKTKDEKDLPENDKQRGASAKFQKRIIARRNTTVGIVQPTAQPEDQPPVLQCKLPLDKITAILTKIRKPDDSSDGDASPKPAPSSSPRIMCLFCDRTFTSGVLLQKHTERCHHISGTRRASARNSDQAAASNNCQFHPGCSMCTKNNGVQNASNDLPALFDHMLTSHPVKYFACRPCKMRFSSHTALQAHTSELHDLKTPDEQTSDDKPSPKSKTGLKHVGSSRQSIIKNPIAKRVTVDMSKSNLYLQKPPITKEPADLEESISISSNENSGTASRLGESSNCSSSSFEEIRKSTRNRDNSSNPRSKNETSDTQILSRLGLAQNRTLRVRSVRRSRKPPVNEVRATSEINRKEKVKAKTEVTEFVINKNKNDPSAKFDPDFYSTVSMNVRENLLKHLDGKLGTENIACDVPSILDPKVKSTHAVMDQSFSSQPAEIHCSDVTLNAITIFPTLLTSDQYGSDKIPHYSYGANLQNFKKIITKNSWKWKWDPIKKYKYCNEDGKIVRKIRPLQHVSPRDLSKLDIWTQLTMREKYDAILGTKNSSYNEVSDNVKLEQQKQINELNMIFNKRVFPQIEKENQRYQLSDSESDIVEKETDEKVAMTEVKMKKDVETANDDSDLNKMLNSLGLMRKPNSPETLPAPVLSGEWARPRMYVCQVCGRVADCLRILEAHQAVHHPYVHATHYELVGQELLDGELYKHLYIPGFKKLDPKNRSHSNETLASPVKKRLMSMNGPTRVLRTAARSIKAQEKECTKCQKMLSPNELYRHILECAGDYGWIMAKKKCKYKPFGARRRRLKGLYKRERPDNKDDSNDNTVKEQPVRPKLPPRPRTKNDDADSIQRMLANLPAKRASRQILDLPRPKVKNHLRSEQKPNHVLRRLIPSKNSITRNNVISTRVVTTIKDGLSKKVCRVTRSIANNLQSLRQRTILRSKEITIKNTVINSKVSVKVKKVDEKSSESTSSRAEVRDISENSSANSSPKISRASRSRVISAVATSTDNPKKSSSEEEDDEEATKTKVLPRRNRISKNVSAAVATKPSNSPQRDTSPKIIRRLRRPVISSKIIETPIPVGTRIVAKGRTTRLSEKANNKESDNDTSVENTLDSANEFKPIETENVQQVAIKDSDVVTEKPKLKKNPKKSIFPLKWIGNKKIKGNKSKVKKQIRQSPEVVVETNTVDSSVGKVEPQKETVPDLQISEVSSSLINDQKDTNESDSSIEVSTSDIKDVIDVPVKSKRKNFIVSKIPSLAEMENSSEVTESGLDCSLNDIDMASRTNRDGLNFSSLRNVNNRSRSTESSRQTQSIESKSKSKVEKIIESKIMDMYNADAAFRGTYPLAGSSGLMAGNMIEPIRLLHHEYDANVNNIDKPPLYVAQNYYAYHNHLRSLSVGSAIPANMYAAPSNIFQPHKHSTPKPTKSKRGLNDCIAMLKDKLTEKPATSTDIHINSNPIYGAPALPPPKMNETDSRHLPSPYEELVQPLDLSGRMPQAEDLSIKSLKKETISKTSVSSTTKNTTPTKARKPVFDPTLRIPQYPTNQMLTNMGSPTKKSTNTETKKRPVTDFTISALVVPDRKLMPPPPPLPPPPVVYHNLAYLNPELALLPHSLVETIEKLPPHKRDDIIKALPQALTQAVESLQIMKPESSANQAHNTAAYHYNNSLLPANSVTLKRDQRILNPPKTTEISTQTPSNEKELIDDVPPEFVNVNTDLFLIDPVTGMITERPQNDLQEQQVEKPCEFKVPYPSVTEGVVEKETKEVSNSLLDKNSAIPEIANLLTEVLTDKPKKLAESAKIADGATASLRAVRIKSVNKRHKSLDSVQSIQQPEIDILQTVSKEVAPFAVNRLKAFPISAKDGAHKIVRESNVKNLQFIQQDEVSSTEQSQAQSSLVEPTENAQKPLVESNNKNSAVVFNDETKNPFAIPKAGKTKRNKRSLRNVCKEAVIIENTENTSPPAEEIVEDVTPTKQKKGGRHRKSKNQPKEPVEQKLENESKIVEDEKLNSPVLKQSPTKQSDGEVPQKSFSQLLMEENNTISETAVTPSNILEFKPNENELEKCVDNDPNKPSDLNLEEKQESMVRRSLRKNKSKSIDKITEKVFSNLETSDNCSDTCLNPDISGAAYIPEDSYKANLGKTDIKEISTVLSDLEPEDKTIKATSDNDESDDDVCLALVAKKKFTTPSSEPEQTQTKPESALKEVEKPPAKKEAKNKIKEKPTAFDETPIIELSQKRNRKNKKQPETVPSVENVETVITDEINNGKEIAEEVVKALESESVEQPTKDETVFKIPFDNVNSESSQQIADVKPAAKKGRKPGKNTKSPIVDIPPIEKSGSEKPTPLAEKLSPLIEEPEILVPIFVTTVKKGRKSANKKNVSLKDIKIKNLFDTPEIDDKEESKLQVEEIKNVECVDSIDPNATFEDKQLADEIQPDDTPKRKTRRTAKKINPIPTEVEIVKEAQELEPVNDNAKKTDLTAEVKDSSSEETKMLRKTRLQTSTIVQENKVEVEAASEPKIINEDKNSETLRNSKTRSGKNITTTNDSDNEKSQTKPEEESANEVEEPVIKEPESVVTVEKKKKRGRKPNSVNTKKNIEKDDPVASKTEDSIKGTEELANLSKDSETQLNLDLTPDFIAPKEDSLTPATKKHKNKSLIDKSVKTKDDTSESETANVEVSRKATKLPSHENKPSKKSEPKMVSINSVELSENGHLIFKMQKDTIKTTNNDTKEEEHAPKTKKKSSKKKKKHLTDDSNNSNATNNAENESLNLDDSLVDLNPPFIDPYSPSEIDKVVEPDSYMDKSKKPSSYLQKNSDSSESNESTSKPFASSTPIEISDVKKSKRNKRFFDENQTKDSDPDSSASESLPKKDTASEENESTQDDSSDTDDQEIIKLSHQIRKSKLKVTKLLLSENKAALRNKEKKSKFQEADSSTDVKQNIVLKVKGKSLMVENKNSTVKSSNDSLSNITTDDDTDVPLAQFSKKLRSNKKELQFLDKKDLQPINVATSSTSKVEKATPEKPKKGRKTSVNASIPSPDAVVFDENKEETVGSSSKSVEVEDSKKSKSFDSTDNSAKKRNMKRKYKSSDQETSDSKESSSDDVPTKAEEDSLLKNRKADDSKTDKVDDDDEDSSSNPPPPPTDKPPKRDDRKGKDSRSNSFTDKFDSFGGEERIQIAQPKNRTPKKKQKIEPQPGTSRQAEVPKEPKNKIVKPERIENEQAPNSPIIKKSTYEISTDNILKDNKRKRRNEKPKNQDGRASETEIDHEKLSQTPTKSKEENSKPDKKTVFKQADSSSIIKPTTDERKSDDPGLSSDDKTVGGKKRRKMMNQNDEPQENLIKNIPEESVKTENDDKKIETEVTSNANAKSPQPSCSYVYEPEQRVTEVKKAVVEENPIEDKIAIEEEQNIEEGEILDEDFMEPFVADEEQFLADFGMFMDRPHRKSTILAIQKISQTFKPDSSDTDDIDGRSRKRPNRAQKKRYKKSGDKPNDLPPPRNLPLTSGLPSRLPKKKPPPKPEESDSCLSSDDSSVKKDPSSNKPDTYCLICKRKFRRPENLQKHNMTLMHISRLSEIEAKEMEMKSTKENQRSPVIDDQKPCCSKDLVDPPAIVQTPTPSPQEGKSGRSYKSLAERKSFDSNTTAFPPKTEESKADQSANAEIEPKRKELSRDEALFFECCSLLKESDTSRKQVSEPDEKPSVEYKYSVKMGPSENLQERLDKSKDYYNNVTSDTSFGGILDDYKPKKSGKHNKSSKRSRDTSLESDGAAANKSSTNDLYSAEALMVRTNSDDFSDNGDSVTSNHDAAVVEESPKPTTLPNKIDVFNPILEFEDKFDKIKRKAREKAQAAKEAMAAAINPKLASGKTPKKVQKTRKIPKPEKDPKKPPKTNPPQDKKDAPPPETVQSQKVLTKGALKGFDGISIPTQEIKPLVTSNEQIQDYPPSSSKPSESPPAKPLKNKSLQNPKNGTPKSSQPVPVPLPSEPVENHKISTYKTNNDEKQLDIYEFFDDEDDNASEGFKFRSPTTNNNRDRDTSSKKSADSFMTCISNLEKPQPSVLNNEDSQISSLSFSDREDFTYISEDDYNQNSHTEEDTNLSSTFNELSRSQLKKNKKVVKEKGIAKKNVIMGKIFKNNAFRNELKNSNETSLEHTKEIINNIQTDMDQLFDSLLGGQTNNHDAHVNDSVPRHSLPELNETEGNSDMMDITDDINTQLSDSAADISEDYESEEESRSQTQARHRKIVPRLKATLSDDMLKKPKSSKKIANYDNNNMNSSEYKDKIGVASRKSQRKCTTGKQNILVESWSSESDFEDFRQFEEYSSVPKTHRSHRKPRRSGRHRNSEDHKIVTDNNINRLQDGTKGQSGEFKVIPDVVDDVPKSSNGDNKEPRNGKKRRRRQSEQSSDCEDIKSGGGADPSSQQQRTKRTASEMLYYWPSSSDEEGAPQPQVLQPISTGERESEPIEQHGWIVGDSHKKLVTMLAHAKGRKLDDSVKDKKNRPST